MSEEELEIKQEAPQEVEHFPYYASVLMNGVPRPYYFGTEDDSLETDEYVIVDTITGYELGKIVEEPRSTSSYKSSLPLKRIIRRASENDFRNREHFDSRSDDALKICDEEAKKLDLNMRFLTLHYSVDGAKCTVTYSSDARVDFRELLKVLAPKLNARIDLRQVAPRDRAKSVGGVGICGLPLCCSTFLTRFDTISISRAKNQMLSLNIPKLSGSCGKLMCCLAFEDDLYTEEKAKFPKVGSMVRIGKNEYKVDSFNIISRTIKLTSHLDTKFITLEEYTNIVNPPHRKEEGFFEEFLPKDNQSRLEEMERAQKEDRIYDNERVSVNQNNKNNRHHKNKNKNYNGKNNRNK